MFWSRNNLPEVASKQPQIVMLGEHQYVARCFEMSLDAAPLDCCAFESGYLTQIKPERS